MIYPIKPVPAPRQTRADKWKPRPCVIRYRDFRDEVARHKIELECPFKVVFFIPMPKTWSKRKKELWNGRPHLQTPDTDNLYKALLDAVFRHSDDKHMWSINAEKRWSYTGAIEIKAVEV